MKTYIYMNEKIRDRTNVDSDHPEPVITVQRGRSRIYCNEVEIGGRSRIRFGKLKAHGHQVTAWVETTAQVKITK